MHSIQIFILSVLLLLVCATSVNAAGAPETKEQRDTRMAWWREARFGMFIHWGVYSIPAGTWNGKRVDGIGEWIMNFNHIPCADYQKLPAQFNPTKFDADEWVSIAKRAGMKYIIITSKHHDGFAMFHSKSSAFNIYDATPFKRDPLAELAAACQKQGIKLGFYYSQAQDWNHPGGSAILGKWDKAQDGSMDDYLRDVAVPQVRELLTNYGPVAVLWWDTPEGMTKERCDLLKPLLALQPNIITNDRLGDGSGDSGTPEQEIPENGLPGRDWETCMTINDTWGYKSYDTNFKSAEKLIRNLIDIASKGGNYLLNVGPTSEGVIPQPEIDRLAAMGEWLKVNGDAIYGTGASPFAHTSFDGQCTVKGDRLFVHVFNWPSESVRLIGLKTAVISATSLIDGQAVEFTSSPDGIAIKPPAHRDPIATVVVLKLASPPVVEGSPQRK